MTRDTATAPVDVVVIGRANIDLTVRVPYRPGLGRTAFGSELVSTPGGKSLNQAIAVARLGGRSSLVANAGADHWGDQLLTALTRADVDTRHFQLLAGVRTGAAIIEITPDGENFVVLALSPATELTAEQVDRALVQIAPSVVTVQLDMPPEPIAAALAEPLTEAVYIGNLTPRPDLDRSLMSRLDVLVVNEHEAAAILGTAEVEPLAAARQLRQLGPPAVVVTAGACGAAYSDLERSGTIAAAAVPVVDTTGAGDAFLGSLARALSRNVSLPDAVAQAVRAGTNAVQHNGAQLPPTVDP